MRAMHIGFRLAMTETATKTEKPQPTKYKLTLKANPENAGATTGSGEYYADKDVAITATANEGWKFVEWEGAGKASAANYKMPARNITLTAKFEETETPQTEPKPKPEPKPEIKTETPQVTGTPQPPKTTPQPKPQEKTPETPQVAVTPQGAGDEENMLIKLIREREKFPLKYFTVVPGGYPAVSDDSKPPLKNIIGGVFYPCWETGNVIKSQLLKIVSNNAAYPVERVMEERAKNPNALPGVVLTGYWQFTLTEEGKKYLVSETEYSKGKLENDSWFSGAVDIKNPITFNEYFSQNDTRRLQGHIPEAMYKLPVYLGVAYQGTADLKKIISIEKKDMIEEYKKYDADLSKIPYKSYITYEIQWEGYFTEATPFGCQNQHYSDNYHSGKQLLTTTITIIDGKIDKYSTY
jgi:hypothetical protein